MSTLESVIWHILGYSAIPVILLSGIFIATVIYFILLELSGRSGNE
jgi:uncharacterized protein (TIGR02808 family)